MKKLLTTLFLACLFWVVNGQTNVYHPFPTDSAYWSVIHGYEDPFGTTCTRSVQYGMIGDTLIEGSTYSKIYANNLWFSDSDTTFNPATAEYYAALKEDSTKKVFVRRATDTTDILLYDFSLELGDTFCFDFFNHLCSPVLFIDSILVNTSYRRVIKIQVSETQYWIEGIGNLYGLFDLSQTGSNFNYLACFHNNDYSFSHHPFSPIQGCHCDNGIGIPEHPPFTSTLYPNPATNSATLEFENPTNTAFNLQVFDITGRVVIEQSIITTNRIQLNTQHLPAGIYHYRLIAAEEKLQSFGKLIID